MNARIKELSELAGFDYRDHAYNINKFAELIILECSNAVQDDTKEGDHYSMRIEQHFTRGPAGILHFGLDK